MHFKMPISRTPSGEGGFLVVVYGIYVRSALCGLLALCFFGFYELYYY